MSECKFKVGDYIVCVSGHDAGITVGNKYTVSKVSKVGSDDNAGWAVWGYFNRKEFYTWYAEDRFDLYAPVESDVEDEVAIAAEPVLPIKAYAMPYSTAPLSVAPKGQAGGLKFDAGKDQWGLLLAARGMLAAVRGVVRVLMFGAEKYAAHSWRDVEDNERRYLDGLMRHYSAIMEHGLKARDEESGLLHIDHLNCNGLFLGEIARND